jgi:hypothetical protein
MVLYRLHRVPMPRPRPPIDDDDDDDDEDGDELLPTAALLFGLLFLAIAWLA